MSIGVKFELRLLIVILLVSVVLGQIADNSQLMLSLGLLVYLSWHTYQALRFVALRRGHRRIQS